MKTRIEAKRPVSEKKITVSHSGLIAPSPAKRAVRIKTGQIKLADGRTRPRPSKTAGGHKTPVKMFVDIYKEDQLSIVKKVKRGLDPTALQDLAQSMQLPKENLYETLGLARTRMQRKFRNDMKLSPDESSRVLGMKRLIGQAQAMVEESGNPKGFDAARWLAGWLDKELPALNGHKPAEFMDTAEGQALVSQTLSRMQSGAYA